MRYSRLNSLCITFAGVVLAACAPSISPSEASALSKELRPLLNEMCERGGVVSRAQWPAALVALDPDDVRVRPEGLYARTSTFMASERGMFIACRPSDQFPGSESDPSYHSVADDVYTYYVAG
jgi:hypothetical protein